MASNQALALLAVLACASAGCEINKNGIQGIKLQWVEDARDRNEKAQQLRYVGGLCETGARGGCFKLLHLDADRPGSFDRVDDYLEAGCKHDTFSTCDLWAGHLAFRDDARYSNWQAAAEIYRDRCGAGWPGACTRLAGIWAADQPARTREAVDLYSAACRLGDGLGCMRLSRHALRSRDAKQIEAARAVVAAKCSQGLGGACSAQAELPGGAPGASEDAAALYSRACGLGDLEGCMSQTLLAAQPGTAKSFIAVRLAGEPLNQLPIRESHELIIEPESDLLISGGARLFRLDPETGELLKEYSFVRSPRYVDPAGNWAVADASWTGRDIFVYPLSDTPGAAPGIARTGECLSHLHGGTRSARYSEHQDKLIISEQPSCRFVAELPLAKPHGEIALSSQRMAVAYTNVPDGQPAHIEVLDIDKQAPIVALRLDFWPTSLVLDHGGHWLAATTYLSTNELGLYLYDLSKPEKPPALLTSWKNPAYHYFTSLSFDRLDASLSVLQPDNSLQVFELADGAALFSPALSFPNLHLYEARFIGNDGTLAAVGKDARIPEETVPSGVVIFLRR